MQAYLKRRLLTLIPVILGVTTLVFLIIHLVPGDPVELMLGENARPGDVAAMRTQLGLDQPLWAQYLEFWGGLLKGDLGESITNRRPVAELIGSRLPNTMLLATCAMVVSLLIALPLGVFSALHQRRFLDFFSLGFSVLGISMPVFWLGPLLILVFAYHLSWFPVAGLDSWKHLVLPAVTMGFGLSAITTRMVRSSMIEVMNQDYIRTARAKGLPQRQVIWRHALKNVLIPVITIVGLQLGALFGGAIITEVVFSYPGVGRLLISGIKLRDYPLVQGTILVIALIYILVNLIVDIVYSRVDPRIRLQ